MASSVGRCVKSAARLAALTAGVATVVWGCGPFIGDGDEEPSRDAASDDANVVDEGLDAAKPSDGAGTLDGGSPDGDCPGTAGPKGVRVGPFCIDATEVTTAQYHAFLVAKAGDTSGQPSECAAQTLTPDVWPQAGDGGNPVTWVSWCDAYAYCRWAGKRLCGSVDGGASNVGCLDMATDYSPQNTGGDRVGFRCCSE